MADGIDPVMRAVERAARNPAAHAARRQAELLELAQRDDSVLRFGERGEPPRPWGLGVFRPILRRNPPTPCHSGILAPPP
ncbi:MAG: hypothetical protein ABR581_04655 [Thermoleophilaceae bacterium]